MNELERYKIIIYQYIIFKGDFYKELAKQSTRKLQCTKCLTSSEFEKIYRDLLMNDLFDIIATDLYNLLK